MPTFLTHNSSCFCMPPPSVTLVGVFSSSQRYSSLCEATQSQASSLLLPLPGRCCHLPGGIFFVLQAAPEFRSLVPASPCLVSLHTGSSPCLVSLLTGSGPCTQAPSASLLLAASSSSSLPQDLLPPGTPVCPLSSPSVDWLALGQAIDYNGLLQVGELLSQRTQGLSSFPEHTVGSILPVTPAQRGPLPVGSSGAMFTTHVLQLKIIKIIF